jgi:surfeit locus 1 family protein
MTVRPEQGSGPVSQEAGPLLRSAAALLALGVCAALLFAGFTALGTWQLYRLQWKLALIERVDQRTHAAPVAAPGPDRWQQVSATGDEYRHVRVTGTFLHEQATRVQASTELGSGYWLLTPLRNADGSVVLVNRGFIPVERAGSVRRIPANAQSAAQSVAQDGNARAAPVVVTGLLRISEPGGGFLRHNDPAGDRWYSRDVQAIAAARGLMHVAPYFVDADREPAARMSVDDANEQPIGGLTVISFHNNHLVYALTWYALALMVAAAAWWVAREERKTRRGAAGARADCMDRETDDVRKNRNSGE